MRITYSLNNQVIVPSTIFTLLNVQKCNRDKTSPSASVYTCIHTFKVLSSDSINQYWITNEYPVPWSLQSYVNAYHDLQALNVYWIAPSNSILQFNISGINPNKNSLGDIYFDSGDLVEVTSFSITGTLSEVRKLLKL